MGDVVYAPKFTGHSARAERTTGIARVLVVDGDPAALAAIAQVLQGDGHSTATAFDAPGALAVAERLGPFDLLVTDIQSTAGVELADTLRRRDRGLQVLYITGHRNELFCLTLPLSDDDHVIEKPFSESALLDAVSSLLYWRTPRSAR